MDNVIIYISHTSTDTHQASKDVHQAPEEAQAPEDVHQAPEEAQVPEDKAPEEAQAA